MRCCNSENGHNEMNIRFQKCFLFLILCTAFSCSKDNCQNVSGIWVSNFTVLHFRNDTLFVNVPRGLFRFEQNNSEIILVERLNVGYNSDFDSLILPISLGVISDEGNKLICKCFPYSDYDSSEFRKLVKDPKSELVGIQFSAAYQSIEVNLEIDTVGNAVIQADRFNNKANFYSFQFDKREIDQIMNLATMVSLDSLKESYLEYSCADCSSFSFSFFRSKDTINTHIYASNGHYSIVPLKYLLEDNIFKHIEDSANRPITNQKFFNSKIVQCNFDTACIIEYHRKFDSINYKLPEYDKLGIRQIFDKYYDFKGDNICYHISTDKWGIISNFKFVDPKILHNNEFLEELKTKIKIEPAIFNGVKIDLRDFDCVSYINGESD
jgi:hypothetical protein